MQQGGEIPSDVLRFIDAHIDSAEQLELLRVLGESPERDWDGAALAKASQVDPGALPEQLRVLENRGLVKVTGDNGACVCRLEPTSAASAILLGRLLQVYNERPVPLIRYFYSRQR